MNNFEIENSGSRFCFRRKIADEGYLSSNSLENKKVMNNQFRLYAEQAWRSIERFTGTPTGIPADRYEKNGDGEVLTPHTSLANIGLVLPCFMGAEVLGLISKEESISRTDKVLNFLENVSMEEGLYKNWLKTENYGYSSVYPDSIYSSIDHALLGAGLMVVRSAEQDMKDRANNLLKGINFRSFYDLKNKLFFGGRDNEHNPTNWHYDILPTDGRLVSYIGIMEYGIPEDHYFNLNRIETDDKKGWKSWGGTMFEPLMAQLFVPEEQSKQWQINNAKHIQGQIDYGDENCYGFFGFSSCHSSRGYEENGVPGLGVNGYGVKNKTVTPHALFLAAQSEPEKSLLCLQRLQAVYPGVHTEDFGFYDSVEVGEDKAPSKVQLLLDQAMSFIALVNILKVNSIKRYFCSGKEPVVRSLFQRFDNELLFAHGSEPADGIHSRDLNLQIYCQGKSAVQS